MRRIKTAERISLAISAASLGELCGQKLLAAGKQPLTAKAAKKVREDRGGDAQFAWWVLEQII